jgi:hypothetical protein
MANRVAAGPGIGVDQHGGRGGAHHAELGFGIELALLDQPDVPRHAQHAVRIDAVQVAPVQRRRLRRRMGALTRTQVPATVTEFLFALTEDPLLILLLVNLVLFVAGMFMSTAETILLLALLIAPLLPQFGIDPVHFGVLMVLNLTLGQLTPPFDIVLYVLMQVGEISFDRLVKALVPFYLPILVVLALTVAFPPLVTWLPGLVIGR